MKTCLICDTQATNAAIQCSNCGSEFSYVSDEPDPEFEAYDSSISNSATIPSKPGANIWTKIIAVSLIALVVMFGYSQLSASKIADCRSQAMQANSLIRVVDVRWSMSGCEYLAQHDNFGIGLPNPPVWMQQHTFQIYKAKR